MSRRQRAPEQIRYSAANVVMSNMINRANNPCRHRFEDDAEIVQRLSMSGVQRERRTVVACDIGAAPA